jgi:prepilin-type N-terminal cleavage/methylation domain-containing protein
MKKRFSIVILKKRWAFSLIEVSIVILIIGIVLAGIAQGSRLVREMRIQSAASLTKSSGIDGIKGLAIWLETTSSSSITSSTRGLNPDNNDKVAGWNDINSQKSGKINVTQTSDSLRPTYIVDGIGNLPSIKFNGSTYLSSLASAGGSLPLEANSDNFTYVAVWSSSSIGGGTTEVIFEQNSTALTPGKRSSILLVADNTYGFSGEENDAFGASYKSPSSHISLMTVGQANGINSANLTVKVYANSTTASYTNTTLSASLQNVGLDGFYIGTKANDSEKLNGMISEIMIFDRVLMKEEISEVMNYLSKKYRIKLS